LLFCLPRWFASEDCRGTFKQTLITPTLWRQGVKWNYNAAMNATVDELLKAVDLALAGDWDAAHELVQQNESDATAAWIHAVLHKLEGDPGNSGYWYRRANRKIDTVTEPRAELTAIRNELLSRGKS
jgi:hypothetical protein